MSDRTFVIYHGTPGTNDGCCDGFTAAWAAWTALGEGACYVPAEYGAPLPDLPDGATVYMLDISYPRTVLDELAKRTTLLVLDHHPTAEHELAGAPYAWFRLDRSGAALAWMHFFPDRPIPKLVLYVEDRDLWRWTMDSSRAVNAAIANTGRTFAQWSRLEQVLQCADDPYSAAFRMLLQTGHALMREQERLVEHVAQHAYIAPVGGVLVPCCNATAYISEVGHYLLQRFPDYPFAAVWQRRADGAVIWSLRARKLANGRESFHVGNFAREQFGGGGHACAAGFREHPVDPSFALTDLKDFLGEAMAQVDPNSPQGAALHDRYRHWRRGKTMWLGARDLRVAGPVDIVRDADG